MANIVLLLVKSSLQPSSIPTYRRAWKLFYQFLFNTLPGTSTNIPISPPTLALFIAYLFDHHYASSTVNSYVSAIGYSHKLAGLHDPTKSFFINQMLKGYGKIGCRLDSRLPITLPILYRIVWATSQLSDSFFNTCRFQAMCLFAFYTFARVGEITASASGTTIYLHQVSKLVNDNQEAVAFKVTFLNYKHNYNKSPFSLTISRQTTCCPVQHFLAYLQARGNTPGPLFQMPNGSPVPRAVFTEKLSTALKFCGLDPTRYKGHSFRIGAATHAAEKGMSDAQIRTMGRWKSNAFLKYIRLQSMSI